MKIEKLQLSQITYKRCPYPISLLESLKRIGLNFPIRIEESEDGFICVDGHKRLSAIEDIVKDDASFPKFQEIAVLRIRSRTQAPYTLHNHH